MLPDLDSHSGVPIRETMAFAAAVTPLLLQDRFRQWGLCSESIVLASGLTYLVIRFGVAELLKQYTVHRGMWHSMPAVAIAGLLTFLICAGQDMPIRLFKTGAVVVGYTSHLLLDELYGLGSRHNLVRLRRPLGSTLKLWSNSLWANVSTYSKLVVLIALTLNDLGIIDDSHWKLPRSARTARQAPDTARH
jgi:hypothetical protein